MLGGRGSRVCEGKCKNATNGKISHNEALKKGEKNHLVTSSINGGQNS